MKPAPGRAALAAAITRRNAAAKAVEVAREAFVECAGPEARLYSPIEGRKGDKYLALKSARYDAADHLAKIVEMRESYLDKNHDDRVGLHRTCLSEYGKNADDLLDEARRELDAAEKAEAAMATAMGKADLILANAERDLADAAGDVEAHVQGILHEEAVRLASALMGDARAILGKLGELTFITRGVNFMHRDVVDDPGHPMHEARRVLLWLGGIGRDTGVHQEQCAIEEARKVGAAPWVAAASRLSVDANAPLPTDPKMAVAA